MRLECRFFQCDAAGQIVSSASVPIPEQTFLHTRVVSAAERAFAAVQKKGRGPYEVKEAAIFEIPLRKQDQ